MSTCPSERLPLIQQIIADEAEAFHITVPCPENNGDTMTAPASFQMADQPGSFLAGKASPDALAQVAEQLVRDEQPSNNNELKKLIIGYGLGTDCSNFVYHIQAALHKRLLGVDYADNVFRDSADILQLASSKPGWSMSDEALQTLFTKPSVSVRWLAKTLLKEPQFITGSAQLTAASAAEPVPIDSIVPGDIIGLTPIGRSTICHIGVVAARTIADAGVTELQIWHSLWQKDPYQGGVRLDIVRLHADGTYNFGWPSNAHERLEPHFMRPKALAKSSVSI